MCTGNSCRSQMVEGWLRHFSTINHNKVKIYSAGIETHGVNPMAIRVMKEADIDISYHTSNNIQEYKDMDFDFIITVCDHAKENCPYFPSKAIRFHQNFADPSKIKDTENKILSEFRKTRDEIRDYCKKFIEENLLNI